MGEEAEEEEGVASNASQEDEGGEEESNTEATGKKKKKVKAGSDAPVKLTCCYWLLLAMACSVQLEFFTSILA